jgi:FMN phosphatase YigB (HAD superfamily)
MLYSPASYPDCSAPQADDYAFLRRERADTDWDIFDDVFTSAAAGTRKPNLSFFRHVVENVGGEPSKMVNIQRSLSHFSY